MYFSGIGHDSSLGVWSLTLGSTWWWKMKSAEMDKKSFLALPSGDESWKFCAGEDPSLVSSVPRWMISVPGLQEVLLFHLRLEIWIRHHFLALSPLSHWVFQHGYLTRPSLPAPQDPRQVLFLSRFFRRTIHNHGIFQGAHSFQIDGFVSGPLGILDDILPTNQTDGSPKRRSYGVFPSDKRSWMFRREQQHSMEFPHQLSSRPDYQNTADVPSFTLRTALSAIPFVSEWWGVDVQWFQERSPQAWPNSKELSV